MKRVYVLLVNWNGWGDTIECLESVFRCRGAELRVIVCDNDSGDGSLERIRTWADGRLSSFVPGCGQLRPLSNPPLAKPLLWVEYDRDGAEVGGDLAIDVPLVLIQTGANLGFAGGNNVGLRYILARGDFDAVWILNNDTVVDPHALKALLNRLEEKPAAGMVGSTLLYYDEPKRIQARGGGWYCHWIGLPWHLGRLQSASDPPRRARVERWMNYVVGASLLVSRDFLETIGLMCEDYFLYFEESDWALRGKGRFELAYAPESRVYHKLGRSIGTRSDPRRKSLLCDYYALRNRLLFTRRYYPEALPTIYLSVCVALLSRLAFGRLDLARTVWNLLLGRDIRPPGPGGMV